jgi:hypothetical protein
MEKFTASRLSNNNKVMPNEIIVEDNGVTVKIPGLFSGKSKYFDFNEIASIEMQSPLMGFTTIIFYAGGTNISANGFTSKDAKRIKRLIEDGKKGINNSSSSKRSSSTYRSSNSLHDDIDFRNQMIEASVRTEEIIEKCKRIIIDVIVELKSGQNDYDKDLKLYKRGTKARETLLEILKKRNYTHWNEEYKNINSECEILANKQIAQINENRYAEEDDEDNLEYEDDEDENTEDDSELEADIFNGKIIKKIVSEFSQYIESDFKNVKSIYDFERFSRKREPEQLKVLFYLDNNSYTFNVNFANNKIYSIDLWQIESKQPFITIYCNEVTLEEIVNLLKVILIKSLESIDIQKQINASGFNNAIFCNNSPSQYLCLNDVESIKTKNILKNTEILKQMEDLLPNTQIDVPYTYRKKAFNLVEIESETNEYIELSMRTLFKAIKIVNELQDTSIARRLIRQQCCRESLIIDIDKINI